MTLSPWCLTLGLLVAGPAFTRPAAAQTTPSAQNVAERLERGRVLFEGKGLCFSCHGKNGEGLLGPSTRLAGRPLVHTKPTRADVAAMIKAGIDSAHSASGQVMPPRGGSRLSDPDIDALSQYVLDLAARKKPV